MKVSLINILSSCTNSKIEYIKHNNFFENILDMSLLKSWIQVPILWCKTVLKKEIIDCIGKINKLSIDDIKKVGLSSDILNDCKNINEQDIFNEPYVSLQYIETKIT